MLCLENTEIVIEKQKINPNDINKYYRDTSDNSVVRINDDMNVTGNTFMSGTLNVVGAINSYADITAYYTSDRRLKDNIQPIEKALDKVNKLGGYEFDWNEDAGLEGHDVGVIAQEA